MRREGSFRQTAKCQLDDSIHADRSLAARHGGVLPAYERLLWHVQTRTTLLHPSDRAGDNRNAFNSGLLAQKSETCNRVPRRLRGGAVLLPCRTCQDCLPGLGRMKHPCWSKRGANLANPRQRD
jgi:hypothetical protein